MRTAAEWERRLARREFLKLAGQTAMSALTFTIGSRAWLPPPSGATERANAGSVREIHLEARELMWELAPGRVIKAMAYNGQIPGPEIRLKEGEQVRRAHDGPLAWRRRAACHGRSAGDHPEAGAARGGLRV
jgi:hypothetical protein